MRITILPEGDDPEEARRNAAIPDSLPKLAQHHLFVACTGSGKSVAVVNLLANHYRGAFDKIHLIHSQYDDDPIYKRLDIPAEQIHRVYSDDLLDKIIADITERRKKKKFQSDLIIMDDQMRAFQGSKKLNESLTWIRHKGIAVWAAVQYTKSAVSKLARQQFSAATLWPGNCKDEDLKVLSELSPVGTKAFHAAVAAVRDRNAREGNTFGSLTMNTRRSDPFFYAFDIPIKIKIDGRDRAGYSRRPKAIEALEDPGGSEESSDDDDPGEGTSGSA